MSTSRITYSQTLREELAYMFREWVIIPGKILLRNKKGFAGFIIVLFYIFIGTAGPLIVPYPKTYMFKPYIRPTLLQWPPSFAHPLGTDYFGADIWGEIVWGSRTVLEIAFIAGFITTLIGIAMGMISGFLGGIVDSILEGTTEVMMTIPGLPLLIVLATLIRTAQPWAIGLILSVNAWTGLAMSVRSQVLSLKQIEFVEAAKALGLSTSHIVFREIMPNIMSFIAVNFVFATIGAIYGSVGLYFLGLLPFTSFNWGVMLNMAYSQAGAYMSWSTMHYIMAPIIAIIGLQAGLLFFSYAIDEIFNPRLRTEI